MTVDVLSEGKSGALDLGTARAQKRNRIRDRHFLRELRRLRLLRSFETQVGELPTTEMPDSFGFLLQLRYAPGGVSLQRKNGRRLIG